MLPFPPKLSHPLLFLCPPNAYPQWAPGLGTGQSQGETEILSSAAGVAFKASQQHKSPLLTSAPISGPPRTLLSPLCVCMLSRFSRVRLCESDPWTVARQAPLSTEFSRQEYWSGLLCPPPEDFPSPGIEPLSLPSPALAGRFFTTSAPSSPP